MKKLIYGSLILAAGSMVHAQPNVPALDGTLTDSAYGNAVATQTVQTNFGDNSDTNNSGADGSELDQLFITDIDDALVLGIAGNAETNGNQIQILIDIEDVSSGVSVVPAADFGALEDLTLPDDLDLDLMFSPNAGSGNPQQDLFMNMHDYTAGSGESLFVAEVIGDGSPNTVTAGPVTTDLTSLTNFGGNFDETEFILALNNSNVAGVGPGSGAASGDPAAVDTGLEVAIDMRILDELNGAPLQNGDEVSVLLILTGSSGTFLSNQLLPPLNNPSGNLGNANTVDLSSSGLDNDTVTYTLANQGATSVGNWQIYD